MDEELAIDIAADFGRMPFGRFLTDGKFSGERFREEVLRPAIARAIATGRRLTIKIDGVAGLPSSFIDEAFGGLVRVHNMDPQQILKAVEIVATTPRLRDRPAIVRDYVLRAAHRPAAG